MTKTKADGAMIDVKSLRTALRAVVGAVERRSTVPILSNVLLECGQNATVITGTDLDITIASATSGIEGNAFTTTVDANVFDKLLAKLPQEARATLCAADGKLTITAGRARFSLPTLPIDDFPRPPLKGFEHTFEIDALMLGSALDRTRHAISSDETRYYLGGVFVHAPAEQGLRFAATNGHVLARMVFDAPDGIEGMPDVIVPRKATAILGQLLDKAEGAIGVEVGRTGMRFTVGETTLFTKTIDGTFPDYTRVIPNGNDKTLAFDRGPLIAAIERVITVVTDKTRAVKLSLTRDLVTVSARSPEHGEGREEVPCSYSDAPIEVGFNARYLLDTLSHLTADTGTASFASSEAPTVWQDSGDSPALFVIMPMRV